MDAEALGALRDRLLATLPSTHARRAEVDAEAILEAKGYACRPGPKVKTSHTVTSIIAAAQKGPYRLIVWYRGAQDPDPRRRVIEPYGLLLGTRHYLIARDSAKNTSLRRFRRTQQRLIGEDCLCHRGSAFGLAGAAGPAIVQAIA
jgi:hypothetical protein